jgi:hypothetical protein
VRRPTAFLALAVIMIASSSGCSQVQQLQPVAGAQISAVRTATNDVLVDSGVPIEVAPVCEFADPLFVCRGSAADGLEIVAEAEVLTPYGQTKDEWGAYVPADVSLVIKVGARTIYQGSVEDVLVENGQVS